MQALASGGLQAATAQQDPCAARPTRRHHTAPVYPPELSARGTEGKVEAAYVVDTTGRVDTTTIRVMQSDDPRFTESVRAALAESRFRPAKRAGKAVRQLVQQRFRFKLAPTSGGAGRPS